MASRIESKGSISTDRSGGSLGPCARSEPACGASEDRFHLASRCLQDGVWDWDLRSDKIYFSARWYEILDRAGAETVDGPAAWYELVHPDDLDRLQQELQIGLESEETLFQSEHRLRHRDGGYLWVLVRAIIVRDQYGTPRRMVGAQTDVSHSRRLADELNGDAGRDPLTGLPDRRLFEIRLEQALDRAQRHPRYLFGVFFIDLDCFKSVNDQLGHLIGDRLLRQVAERLADCIRPGDMVARWGGDEFTLLVDDLRHQADALCVAERIGQRMALPFEVDDRKLAITASIGIATSSPTRTEPEEMIRDADRAMYDAKAQGSGSYAMCDRKRSRRLPR